MFVIDPQRQPPRTGWTALPTVPFPGNAELITSPRPRRRSRRLAVVLAVIGLVFLLVGSLGMLLRVRAQPTLVAGRASAGGGQPALQSPRVSDGFSLVRDDQEGFAVLVPTSFFKFELSRQNLDSLARQLAEHPDPDLAEVLRQSRDLVSAGGVLLFYDERSGDTEVLRKVTDLPAMSTDFLNGVLDELRSKGIDPLSAERTDVMGVPAVTVTFVGAPDGTDHGPLVTELFLAGYRSGWVLSLESTALDPASRDTVMNSLRVV